MRRMVWVAVGAVGGVLAYRKAQELLVDARDKGVVLSAQQAGLSAAAALASARTLASGAASVLDQARTSPTPGAAASRVLKTAKQGEQ